MPSFRLSAHHVTSPDTSRGATQHARLKSVQSQNAPSLFPCAKSLRRRISSQIGWLTQNSEPSSQPADPRDGARDGLDAPAHRSAPGLTSRTRSTQRQVDISRQLWSRRRLQAANYKDRSTRLYRPVVVASPAGRTRRILGARAALAAASVRMHDGTGTRRGLQRHREPRSTSFWSVACPLSQSGHCAARGSHAHHRADQLADC